MFSRKLQNGVGVKKAESRYFLGLFVVGAPGIEPWASYEIRIFEREPRLRRGEVWMLRHALPSVDERRSDGGVSGLRHCGAMRRTCFPQTIPADVPATGGRSLALCLR